MGHDEHGPAYPSDYFDSGPDRLRREEIEGSISTVEPPLWQRLAMLALVLGVLYWLFSTGH